MGVDERLTSHRVERRIRHQCQLQLLGARCFGTANMSEVFGCSQRGCGQSFASRKSFSEHLGLAHGNSVVSMVTCGISRHKCSGKQEVTLSLEFNSSPDPGGDYHHHHVCMYVCKLICMYATLCVCMHLCMYVCAYVCICIMYVCMYVYATLCVCTCLYVILCTYVCRYVCMYVHVCMYICMYACMQL